MLRNVVEALTDSCMSILTENLAVFRDNRRWVPEDRRVGWLRVTKNGFVPVRIDTPTVPNGVTTITFPKRGLFNQINRDYNPRSSNQAAQGEKIPEEVRRSYEEMIEDENFTLKERGHDARRPSKIEAEWLKDFAVQQQASTQYWWFRANNANQVI